MKKLILFLVILLSISAFSANIYSELYTSPASMVTVNDIEIAYKIFGKGDPTIFIMGYGSTLESWDPTFLTGMAKERKLILFDNRGTGGTSVGKETFSIKLFAEDTAGLIKALGYDKVDIFAWSMGTYIAQELAFNYPELIEKIVLYASDCGGNKAIPPSQEALKLFQEVSTNPADAFVKLLFPEDWLKDNPEMAKRFQQAFSGSGGEDKKTADSTGKQYEAIANWKGTFDKLKDLHDVLLITGTEDISVPPENSMIMAKECFDSWLVRIPEGGHGLMYQFPEELSEITLFFLK